MKMINKIIIILAIVFAANIAIAEVKTEQIKQERYDSFAECRLSMLFAIDAMRNSDYMSQFPNAEFVSVINSASQEAFAYIIRINNSNDSKTYYGCEGRKGKIWITYIS